MPVIERSGLFVTDVEVLRLHYAETLRLWRERFLARRDEAVAIAGERFARMWELYLAGAEASFRYGGNWRYSDPIGQRRRAPAPDPRLHRGSRAASRRPGTGRRPSDSHGGE